MTASVGSANRRTALKLGVVVLGMFGFGYALVPIYDVVCEALGLNGKTRGEAVQLAPGQADRVDTSRIITVEFISQVNGSLPWEFGSPVRKLQVHPGEVAEVVFEAHNLARVPYTGQAVPSVAPVEAARHFVKTECFCFINQTLAAGERADMPLRFMVDPRLPAGVTTITLSYTFFGVDQPARTAGVATPVPGSTELHPADRTWGT